MITHLGDKEERTQFLREVLACTEKKHRRPLGSCILRRRHPQTISPHASQKRVALSQGQRLFPKKYAFDITRCILIRRVNREEQRELLYDKQTINDCICQDGCRCEAANLQDVGISL